MKTLSTDTLSPHDNFSAREKEIIYYLSTGMSPLQISRETGLNVKTISHHKRKAMKKLGIKNNIELLYWLLRT